MNATANTVDISLNTTVSAYDESLTNDYQAYWNYRNQQYSSDFVGGLTQGQTYYVQVINGTQIELTTVPGGTPVAV
jgi:hypothetical protein